MVTKTPTELRAEIDALRVEMAQAQLPHVTAMLNALRSEAFQATMTALADGAKELDAGSTVVTRVNNIVTQFGNLAVAIARESQVMQEIITPPSASAQPA